MLNLAAFTRAVAEQPPIAHTSGRPIIGLRSGPGDTCVNNPVRALHLAAVSGFVLGHDVLRDTTPVPKLRIAVVPAPLTDGPEPLAVGGSSVTGTRAAARRTRRHGTARSRPRTAPSPFAGPTDHGLDRGVKTVGVRGRGLGCSCSRRIRSQHFPSPRSFTCLCLALGARQQCHRRLGRQWSAQHCAAFHIALLRSVGMGRADALSTVSVNGRIDGRANPAMSATAGQKGVGTAARITATF